MTRKNNKAYFGLFLSICLFAAPRAEANPLPGCQEFHTNISGNQVVLELEFWKSCYDTAPAPEDVLLMRDLFVMDVDFDLSEDEFSYYLTGIDNVVSGNKHHYIASLNSYDDIINIFGIAEGRECASLDVEMGLNKAILTISLQTSCLEDPEADFEYIVKAMGDVLPPLEWTEHDSGDYIESTAIYTFEYNENHALYYEVGLRSGNDTFYAHHIHNPNDNYDPDNNDPDEENEDPGEQMHGDGGTGCNFGGKSTPGKLPLFLLLFAPLLFWRRRKPA